MSTRSYILIENTDGTFSGIYCHFDGYPKGVGATLLDSYRTEAKIRELIALGTLSSLSSSPETSVINHYDAKDAFRKFFKALPREDTAESNTGMFLPGMVIGWFIQTIQKPIPGLQALFEE